MAKHGKIETDKLCNDSKMLQDYMRHFEQQSCGCKTQAQTAAIHLMTFENHASLLQEHKTLQDIHTNVRALHCNNLYHIRSHLNNVYASEKLVRG